MQVYKRSIYFLHNVIQKRDPLVMMFLDLLMLKFFLVSYSSLCTLIMTLHNKNFKYITRTLSTTALKYKKVYLNFHWLLFHVAQPSLWCCKTLAAYRDIGPLIFCRRIRKLQRYIRAVQPHPTPQIFSVYELCSHAEWTQAIFYKLQV